MEPQDTITPRSSREPTVIAFINPKSGGGLGQRLIEKLQALLGDDHVFSLIPDGPEPGLKKWKKTRNLRVIAGGGDGTVGWILSVCDKLKLKKYPMVVPMPLGTANDMSRVLRWGSNFTSSSSADVEEFVQNVRDGICLKMDRWHLSTTELSPDSVKQLRAEYGFSSESAPSDADESSDQKEDDEELQYEPVTIKVEDDEGDASGAAKELPKDAIEGIAHVSSTPRLESPAVDTKEYVVNNYFSIGFDSQVMLDFHEQRHSRPGLFVHPVVNKAVVGVHGMSAGLKNLVSPALHKFVYFELDGKPVKLPKRIHALVVLQIPSYASGTDIWGSYDKTTNQTQRPTVNDGLFEVIGIKGILHIGRMFTGISTGLRLGQGSSCTMVVTQPIAMQVDGEPYWLNPSRCEVSFHNQSRLLFNMKKKGEKKWTHLTGTEPPESSAKRSDAAGSGDAASSSKTPRSTSGDETSRKSTK